MATKTLTIRVMAGDRHPEPDLLVVEVPSFPRGGFPPPGKSWEPLLEGDGMGWGYPVFWKQSDLLALMCEEADYRLKSSQWSERCWFLVGKIVRDPSGSLWGAIHKCIPSVDVRSSASSFEFGPDTWAALQAEKGPEELTLGWLHSHSIGFLRKTERDIGGKHYTPEEPAESQGRVASGLFLSLQDIESALKRGFNGPYQLTCILDSDVCTPDRSGISLGEVLGVWGWFGANLCRRSIHMIKDAE